MDKASSLLTGFSAPEAFDGFLLLASVVFLGGSGSFGLVASGSLVMVALALLELAMVELALMGLGTVELAMVELITKTEGSVIPLLLTDLEMMTVKLVLTSCCLGS